MGRPYKACPLLTHANAPFFYPTPQPCSPLNPPAQRGEEFRSIREGERNRRSLCSGRNFLLF